MTFTYLNVRAHWLDAIKCRRTCIARIRNAVLNADAPHYGFWSL